MNAPRTLSAVIGVAESIAANWAMYEQVEAGLLPSPLHGTSYDGAGGHSSTVPDPTGQLATQLTGSGHGIHNLADTTDALNAVLTQLRWAQSRVNTLIRQHPDLARDADATVRALRCDGSVDPTCTRNAVKGGICHACIKARQRQNNGTVVDMSTRSVLEPVACEPRPVEPTRLPSGAITVERKEWCRTCGLSIDTAVLAEHQERCTG